MKEREREREPKTGLKWTDGQSEVDAATIYKYTHTHENILS